MAKDTDFIRSQIAGDLEDIRKSYSIFNKTSIGNLGLIVAMDTDIDNKKKAYAIIEDYFEYRNKLDNNITQFFDYLYRENSLLIFIIIVIIIGTIIGIMCS